MATIATPAHAPAHDRASLEVRRRGVDSLQVWGRASAEGGQPPMEVAGARGLGRLALGVIALTVRKRTAEEA